jgi:cation/acetate symporter
VGLTILSKSVWVDVFHNKTEIFPYTSPALFSMIVGFVGVWLFSVTDKSKRAAIDLAGFEAQEVRSETGIGASAASAH